MRGLCVDGPNQGEQFNVTGIEHRFKIVDPSERALFWEQDPESLEQPLKVNTYYRVESNPFAEAYGFGALYRYSRSNNY